MRRGLALKFQKDFNEAVADFKEAGKLANTDNDRGDVEKYIRLCEEDRDHQKKLEAIMANAKSLEGKEYIDYLINYLKEGSEEAARKAAENQAAYW